MRAILTDQVA